jgi:putative phosphoesterase
MRLLLIADVHANWEALLTLQRAEKQPDAVLFAGDAVGYGPDPALCARWLLTHATLGVRGNHDAAMAVTACSGAPAELAEAAEDTLSYARRVVAPAEVAGLAHWPLTATGTYGGARFYVVHGTPDDPLTGTLNAATASDAELDALFGDIAADVIVLGHTHMPALRRFGDKLIVNPGSLGQPRYGVPDATFAAWEDGRVQIHHLHYDHDATMQRLRLAPLDPETVEVLVDVLEHGMIG